MAPLSTSAHPRTVSTMAGPDQTGWVATNAALRIGLKPPLANAPGLPSRCSAAITSVQARGT
jgi:hypothetical protein